MRLPLSLLLLLGMCVITASCRPADRAKGEPERQNPARALAPTQNPLHIHQERDVPFDEHGAPFHFVLDAAGPNIDSLIVHLTIQSPSYETVYDRTWRSSAYIDCQCAPKEEPTLLPQIRRETDAYLRGMFVDSVFHQAKPDSARWWEQEDTRTSSLFTLTPQLLPPSATHADTERIRYAIGHEAPTPYDTTARAILTGVRKRPVFWYQHAAEGYCIAAWAPEVHRVVDVMCGP